jgi:hypothetical protein
MNTYPLMHMKTFYFHLPTYIHFYTPDIVVIPPFTTANTPPVHV